MDPNNFKLVTGKCVGASSVYNSEMSELDENRLFANADDSTLLAVVRKLPGGYCCLPLTGTWLGLRSGAITGAWY